MNMMAAISTESAAPVSPPCQAARARDKLADSFLALESDVCDLVRLALLAERQVQRAIGDLRHEDGICVEVPDTGEAELAMFAASLLAEKVQGLKREWYRRYDVATEAAQAL